MLVINDLADALNTAIAATDKDGHPISTTPQMHIYAKAVVDTLTAGLVNNASGTINGTAAPGGPLTLGTGIGGLISGLLATTWEADMNSGNPGANPAMITGEAVASTGYLMASSLVGFASGDITGSCTATPTSPGLLANGAGTGGVISGLSGTPWAAAVIGTFPGASPTLTQSIYNAVASYIEAHAVSVYSTGLVVGTFSAGGGPLLGGTGIDGTIS